MMMFLRKSVVIVPRGQRRLWCVARGGSLGSLRHFALARILLMYTN